MMASLRQLVWQRASGCCEYCLLPQAHDPRPFHLDHIRSQKHDGPTTLENLALSCSACSLFKGPNIAGIDPETNSIQPLYHPRDQVWSEHFRLDDGVVVGLSAIARATIRVLRINDELRIKHRVLLIELGVFPPKSANESFPT